MRTHPGIVAVFVICLISVSLPCLGGTILSTERSVEELKLMTTPELAGEARSVCGGIVASMKNAQEWSAEGTKRRDSKFHDNARKESELAAAGRNGSRGPRLFHRHREVERRGVLDHVGMKVRLRDSRCDADRCRVGRR